MTEYTTSSQAYREYMSARERTTHWLQGLSGGPSELYSPSVPPSVLEGLVPSSPPSEADSSNSTPPKMILRYGDGRPDIPIPHSGRMSRGGSRRHHDPRSQTPSYNPARTRSGSSADSPSYGSHSHPFESEPRAPPEEIRVLPTYGDLPPSSTSSRPSYPRSKSLPRTSDHRHHEPEPEQSPFYAPHAGPIHPHAANAPAPPPPPQANFAQQPQWPTRHPSAKQHPAPAIVYAPAHHSQRPHYAPPAMFHHAPQMGPNGMIYSHSAPVPGQYPPAYPTPYPPPAAAAARIDIRPLRTIPGRMSTTAGGCGRWGGQPGTRAKSTCDCTEHGTVHYDSHLHDKIRKPATLLGSAEAFFSAFSISGSSRMRGRPMARLEGGSCIDGIL
ncbi:hypothetical protein BJ912DRAFT_1078966 [Pholiota molesta]|nr:hypothetical protein BJ912DRAFT_1078966 [Pholiota molesta]